MRRYTLVDFDRLPVDVVRSTEGEVAATSAPTVVLSHPIDDDEPTHVAVVDVAVVRHGPIEIHVAYADLIQGERLAATCSSVLTFTPCFGWSIVAPTVVAPSFTR